MRTAQLRNVASRIAMPLPSQFGTVDEARILSAIVTGLNYGLRIHEQRTRRKAGAEAPTHGLLE
jgi:hypothetical protein